MGWQLILKQVKSTWVDNLSESKKELLNESPSFEVKFSKMTYPDNKKEVPKVIQIAGKSKLTDKEKNDYDENHIKLMLDIVGEKRADWDQFAKDVDIHVLRLKMKYGRPRPYEITDKLKSETDTSKSPSFPSGHATEAYVFAKVLGNKYPKKQKELDSMAEKIAMSRVQMGLHFPSDIEAGKKVAGLIADAYLNIKKNRYRPKVDIRNAEQYERASKDDRKKWHSIQARAYRLRLKNLQAKVNVTDEESPLYQEMVKLQNLYRFHARQYHRIRQNLKRETFYSLELETNRQQQKGLQTPHGNPMPYKELSQEVYETLTDNQKMSYHQGMANLTEGEEKKFHHRMRSRLIKKYIKLPTFAAPKYGGENVRGKTYTKEEYENMTNKEKIKYHWTMTSRNFRAGKRDKGLFHQRMADRLRTNSKLPAFYSPEDENVNKSEDWRKDARGDMEVSELIIMIQQALFYYEELLKKLEEEPVDLESIKEMVRDVIRILREELE